VPKLGSAPGVWPTMLQAAKRGASSLSLLPLLLYHSCRHSFHFGFFRFPFTHNAVSDLWFLPVSVYSRSGFSLCFIQSLWCSVLFPTEIVADITKLVTEHEVRVRGMQKVPGFSHSVRSTKYVCGGCRKCRGFHTGARYWDQIVVRTAFSCNRL
jgi:hypothetical protein